MFLSERVTPARWSRGCAGLDGCLGAVWILLENKDVIVMKRLAICISLLLSPGSALATGAGKLVVTISGLRSDGGQVLLRLYGSAGGFPADDARAIRQVERRIDHGSAVVELEGLSFGSYAVACVHDENGNGKLDTNDEGIRKEGVAASNDAPAGMGSSRWKDARFDFRADRAEIQVRMVY